ncbi:hypothetical protein SYNTR_1650 [Candidatus Syntrophocurvum alkaliphilum]|uniref:Adenosylcobinamide kinase n=1 Tax=Candidatus Syntrophocurvum alkaliphilum TaxID=2293317 RepID=A0A6I6DJI0_9FIRM|nr:bifunctional adenosylcobinamide kinase/adenosylcobinamide-phosphate guanylyltransferase [Candidatus Syntrophocurvum alkaliphilum]QGU00244.1 hypothetical protein SYNTR_1650 [Candidatus Syntrophocurvum alkaliphilum]
MHETIMFIGGSSSGKSSLAEKKTAEYAHQLNIPVYYIATGIQCDEEFLNRIEKHKARRPSSWKTIEEPLSLYEVFHSKKDEEAIFLLDGIGTWVTNLMYHIGSIESFDWNKEKETLFYNQLNLFLKVLKQIKGIVIIVADEVGMDVVPISKEARVFRDLNGITNQHLADIVDDAYFIVSGLSLKLK